MAIGAIAFPGFTGSNEISNREPFCRHIRAVEVISSKAGNTIDSNTSIAPSSIERNANGKDVRWVYTGKTTWHFLIQSNSKAYMFQLENAGGADITNLELFHSVNGYSWESVSGGTFPALSANQAFGVQWGGEALPNGIFIMCKVTCGSGTKVALQLNGG